MTKNTKRERLFLWIEQYEAFKAVANEKGISASELFREAVQQFQMPDDIPKKVRNLTIDKETDIQLQVIANNLFGAFGAGSSVNRSDAAQYVIEQYLKRHFQ
jgi:hypothetical protein